MSLARGVRTSWSELAAAVVFAALPAVVASGQTVAVPVVNHGFENPVLPPGVFAVASAPAGWSAYGPINNNNRSVGALNPATTTLYAVPPPEGANVGLVFLMDNPQNMAFFSNQEAGLQQTLGAVLLTGRRYTLTVEVGNIAVFGAAGFAFGGFPGYRIDLMAGTMVLASDLNSLLPPEGGFLTSTVQIDVGGSHPAAGLPLRIRLVNLNAAVGIEVNFDDVRLDATPIAVWTGLGFGLPGAGGLPIASGTGTFLPGEPNAVTLTGAPPSAAAYLAIGGSGLFAPFLGGVLVPFPDLLFFLPTDASGSSALPFTLLAALPPGVMLYSQWFVQDATLPQGVAMSDGLLVVTP